MSPATFIKISALIDDHFLFLFSAHTILLLLGVQIYVWMWQICPCLRTSREYIAPPAYPLFQPFPKFFSFSFLFFPYHDIRIQHMTRPFGLWFPYFLSLCRFQRFRHQFSQTVLGKFYNQSGEMSDETTPLNETQPCLDHDREAREDGKTGLSRNIDRGFLAIAFLGIHHWASTWLPVRYANLRVQGFI